MAGGEKPTMTAISLAQLLQNMDELILLVSTMLDALATGVHATGGVRLSVVCKT